jgi:hypothetical protein
MLSSVLCKILQNSSVHLYLCVAWTIVSRGATDVSIVGQSRCGVIDYHKARCPGC